MKYLNIFAFNKLRNNNSFRKYLVLSLFLAICILVPLSKFSRTYSLYDENRDLKNYYTFFEDKDRVLAAQESANSVVNFIYYEHGWVVLVNALIYLTGSPEYALFLVTLFNICIYGFMSLKNSSSFLALLFLLFPPVLDLYFSILRSATAWSFIYLALQFKNNYLKIFLGSLSLTIHLSSSVLLCSLLIGFFLFKIQNLNYSREIKKVIFLPFIVLCLFLISFFAYTQIPMHLGRYDFTTQNSLLVNFFWIFLLFILIFQKQKTQATYIAITLLILFFSFQKYIPGVRILALGIPLFYNAIIYLPAMQKKITVILFLLNFCFWWIFWSNFVENLDFFRL